MDKKIVVIYVNLLDEGTPTIRPTNAEVLGDNLYRLHPTERYDPEDETWEFVPGAIVTCERIRTEKGVSALLAVKQVG
ncbi:hypothetical protein [Azospirillum rugosum]|uniref:Uncharacterized protein n=1 Tax=Azospirillum rugosum TaxID=416170 RepID=A0ABS4SQ81_9PROT|nr:hypothetical protein [Azospirillum rugosum]MBP2294112.1 hypothetical protein [Azospirillum rugosum]MDQ0527499.1 hypothetical protein [Azospirillum rugosum]